MASITSIDDIEQQIAEVTARLEHARAQQLAAAEKAYLAAQKATELAQNKVRELTAKASTTVAAQNRLLTATAALEERTIKLVEAQEIFEALKSQQKAKEKFSKKVGKVLAGKSLGKKIKLTREEKKVVKDDKKTAKKIAKAEKKAKQEADPVIHSEESPEPKKPPVRRPAAKKAPIKKPTTEAAPPETNPAIIEPETQPIPEVVDAEQNLETLEASAETNIEAVVDSKPRAEEPESGVEAPEKNTEV